MSPHAEANRDGGGDVTRLLRASASGDEEATHALLPHVYDALRVIAGQIFAQERRHHTLQPTALVHEAFVRLLPNPEAGWESRAHFYAVAAAAMRHILVDHARARASRKRGGDWSRVTIDPSMLSTEKRDPFDLLALDEALTMLGTLDARKARLVELRFFGGVDADDAADMLGIARSTAAEDWRLARAWLHRALKGEAP